jgi:hypothetical protein
MEMELWEHGGGFSLDARVRIAANDRHGLERLLRYCARPPFAAERLEELDAHRLIYHLPKPGPEGRTQLILSPLELLERITALGPTTAPAPPPLLRGLGPQRAFACRPHAPGARGHNHTALGVGEERARRYAASPSHPLPLGDAAGPHLRGLPPELPTMREPNAHPRFHYRGGSGAAHPKADRRARYASADRPGARTPTRGGRAIRARLSR